MSSSPLSATSCYSQESVVLPASRGFGVGVEREADSPLFLRAAQHHPFALATPRDSLQVHPTTSWRSLSPCSFPSSPVSEYQTKIENVLVQLNLTSTCSPSSQKQGNKKKKTKSSLQTHRNSPAAKRTISPPVSPSIGGSAGKVEFPRWESFQQRKENQEKDSLFSQTPITIRQIKKSLRGGGGGNPSKRKGNGTARSLVSKYDPGFPPPCPPPLEQVPPTPISIIELMQDDDDDGKRKEEEKLTTYSAQRVVLRKTQQDEPSSLLGIEKLVFPKLEAKPSHHHTRQKQERIEKPPTRQRLFSLFKSKEPETKASSSSSSSSMQRRRMVPKTTMITTTKVPMPTIQVEKVRNDSTAPPRLPSLYFGKESGGAREKKEDDDDEMDTVKEMVEQVTQDVRYLMVTTAATTTTMKRNRQDETENDTKSFWQQRNRLPENETTEFEGWDCQPNSNLSRRRYPNSISQQQQKITAKLPELLAYERERKQRNDARLEALATLEGQLNRVHPITSSSFSFSSSSTSSSSSSSTLNPLFLLARNAMPFQSDGKEKQPPKASKPKKGKHKQENEHGQDQDQDEMMMAQQLELLQREREQAKAWLVDQPTPGNCGGLLLG